MDDATIVKQLGLSRGFHGEDQIERIVRDVRDDDVVFAGTGKNRNLVHVISGASKAVRQPLAVCGLWVGNTHRAPIATEKVCSKCTRGGTSFSRYNQPRECSSCGRMFADTATRDNSDTTCGPCYEEAGILNGHADGHHKETPADDCPDCAERIHAEGGHEVEGRLDWCEACAVEVRTTNLITLHARGEHATAQLSGCPTCVEEAQAPERVEAPVMTPVASVSDTLVEHRRAVFSFHIDTLASQLRLMADEVQRQGSEITDLAETGNFSRDHLQARALTLANELLQLPGILDVPSLITEAGQLAPEG
jgi:hypothetical protein